MTPSGSTVFPSSCVKLGWAIVPLHQNKILRFGPGLASHRLIFLESPSKLKIFFQLQNGNSTSTESELRFPIPCDHTTEGQTYELEATVEFTESCDHFYPRQKSQEKQIGTLGYNPG